MLRIENLTTEIDAETGVVRAVVRSLAIERGSFALIGESRKSMTALDSAAASG
jgi:ABC-type dipeptide/oligopeptide/nickel transport system ATPase component